MLSSGVSSLDEEEGCDAEVSLGDLGAAPPPEEDVEAALFSVEGEESSESECELEAECERRLLLLLLVPLDLLLAPLFEEGDGYSWWMEVMFEAADAAAMAAAAAACFGELWESADDGAGLSVTELACDIRWDRLAGIAEAAAAAAAAVSPLDEVIGGDLGSPLVSKGHAWGDCGKAGLVGVIRPGGLGVNGLLGGNPQASLTRS